jgi:hypothetical protein
VIARDYFIIIILNENNMTHVEAMGSGSCETHNNNNAASQYIKEILPVHRNEKNYT